ncbi:MAG: RloB family protein [Saprospiraceae bacterium]|nr:RloB family protein [Saprospiraceae bacterium]
MSKRRPPKRKKINPHFWIFCEGETEEAYALWLRAEYRLPIEVVAKVSGSHISKRYIQAYKRGKPTHSKDRDFLMYDADVPEILEQLTRIRHAMLIASNPSIELWFLLHYQDQAARISEEECIRQLSHRNGTKYSKGMLDEKLKKRLKEYCEDACKRASALTLYNNPSTNMHELIRAFEEAKAKQA